MYTKIAALSSVRDNNINNRPKPPQETHHKFRKRSNTAANLSVKSFSLPTKKSVDAALSDSNHFRLHRQEDGGGEGGEHIATGKQEVQFVRVGAISEIKTNSANDESRSKRQLNENGLRDNEDLQMCCSALRKLFSDCTPSDSSMDQDSESVSCSASSTNCCRWRPSFIMLPSSGSHYAWLVVISIAILYNVVLVIARMVFEELQIQYRALWFSLDYVCDTLYLLDILIRFRTGYLEEGLLMRDSKKLAKHYIQSLDFFIDVISILPTDFFYLIHTKKFIFHPGFRLNRLLRFRRLLEFFDRTIRRTSYPNVFRILNLVLYILIIVHWNACFYYAISGAVGYGTDGWVYPNASAPGMDKLSRKYIYSFYWSTLTLLTIGETPHPEKDVEYLFVVADFLVGVLIFATIVGNVGSMITNMNHHSSVFTQKLDGVKRYMKIRKVTQDLEHKVINWFDYLWTNKESLDDDDCLLALPEQLRSEIAMNVHMAALRQAKIFQECAAEEDGLLRELVLKLKLQVFSPGDYVCSMGDIGREMYIVKEGKLEVRGADRELFATLSKGDVFGEISVLEIPGSKMGNRRMANVISVGYSNCLILSKSDLWGLLKDYPVARKKLYDKGRDILTLENMLADPEASISDGYAESSIDTGETIQGMEEHLLNLEEKVHTFISTYTIEKQQLRSRVEQLERLLVEQMPLSTRQLNTLPSAQTEQPQTHASISVTHLKSANNSATPAISSCKTSQLSLSVENLDHIHQSARSQITSTSKENTRSTKYIAPLDRSSYLNDECDD